MDAKLIIIRHGQSLGNAQKRYLGHTDVDLSELGKHQAQIAADYFKDYNISAIYSSDLLRAYNTALPHASLHGLSVNKDEKLREVFLGEWEGCPIDVLREKWREEFEIEWYGRFGTSIPPSGEPVYEAGKRVYEELLRISRVEKGTVLITSHGGAIRAFWCYMQGIEPSRWADTVPFANNASATFVGFDGERLIPISYSFDGYMKPEEKSGINEA